MTNELIQQLNAMTDEDLYEVSEYCARLRAKRKRKERQRKEAKEKESKEKELSLCARAREEFVRPTAEEVAAYCKEKNYTFDPIQFVSYYESKGWIVGRTKMKNWRSACCTWQRNRIKYESEREAECKARAKRFNRSGGWTPPPINEKYIEAQREELRKAGLI